MHHDIQKIIFRLFPIISISQKFFSIFFLTLEKIEFKLEKNIGIEKHGGKVRKCLYTSFWNSFTCYDLTQLDFFSQVCLISSTFSLIFLHSIYSIKREIHFKICIFTILFCNQSTHLRFFQFAPIFFSYR